MKLTEKKLVLLGLTLSIPILLYSAPITIPVTFADGNVLTAAQLNQNFTAILNKINELDAAITSLSDRVNGSGNLLYPDGVNGEAVTEIVTSGSGYTVPAGKTLYINSFTGPLRATIGSTSIQISPTNNVNSPNPIIVKSGLIVYSSSTSTAVFTGLLINKNTIPITEIVYPSISSGYTVPSGKTLFITSFTGQLSYNIGGTNTQIAGNSVNHPNPIIVKSGLTIYSSSTEVITGYIK